MLKRILCLAVLVSPLAVAQTTKPTSAPAALPTSLPVIVPVTPPPGFVRVQVKDYAALCEPKDQTWVKEVLSSIKPTTRPTTTATDLLTRLEAQRPALSAHIGKVLALDPKEIDQYIEQTIVPQVKRFEEMHPTVALLVTTKDKLAEVMKGGWENSRLHYNRLSGEVTYNMAGGVRNEEPLLPSLYLPDIQDAKRREDLSKALADVAVGAEASVAARSVSFMEGAFIQLVGDKAFVPLKAKEDQKWLGVGLSGILGVQFAETVTGLKSDEMIRQMTAEPKGFPFPVAKLDLVHPREIASMRTEYVPYYLDGLRRKSTIVMKAWLDKVGEDVVPKLLVELRKKMPADGDGLVRLIKDVSGVDLSKDVGIQ